jgi:hypothetical protein
MFLECESSAIALKYSMRNLYTVNSEFLNHSRHESMKRTQISHAYNSFYFDVFLVAVHYLTTFSISRPW